MTEATWWACDFKTGQRKWVIPTEARGTVARILGDHRDTTVTARWSDNGVAIPGVDEGTAPGRIVLVSVDEDDRILWGGLTRRRTSTLASSVQVTCDTLEAYLHRRFINTPMSWTDADPAQIAADVLATITDIPLIVDMELTGNATVDGYYDISDNKSIRSVLDDLAGLAGGIDWTIEVEWADAAHTQIRYRVRIGPAGGLGSINAGPPWVHQPGLAGAITQVSYIEDYGTETGANDTLALSSGEGSSQPRSTRYVADELLTAWARFERRFTPATSITSTSTLDQYAEADHAETRLGVQQLSIVANLDAAPRLNLDWWLGDTITVDITSDRFPPVAGTDGLMPGFSAQMRVVGWTLDLDARTLTPLTKEPA